MLPIRVPGLGELEIEHLVLDYNGTMAVDGKLLTGVKSRLVALAKEVRVHVLTADTFGKARGELRRAHAELVILGIAMMQAEGAAALSLAEADIVARDVRDALDLFLRPLRLIATLRN